MWDEITARLLSRVPPATDTMRDHDQIEAIVLAIDPYTLGGTVSSVSADERCTICQDNFSDPAEEYLSLNVCGHPFHTDCLGLLANKVSIGVSSVLCPNCRSRLCKARDHQGLLPS
jgi:hypothetical protein